MGFQDRLLVGEQLFIPLLREVSRLPSQCIQFPTYFPRSVHDLEIETGEEFGPARLSAVEELGVTLGLYRNRSVGRIRGNQATFDNSQRNNLRSCMWVFRGWCWCGRSFSSSRRELVPYIGGRASEKW